MFTSEQDAFILMAHFRSATLNPDGTWSYSLQNCIDQFIECYPKANVHYDLFRQHRQALVRRFENKNCICKTKPTGRPTVLTASVVKAIQNRMDRSPDKSLAKLSEETGLSVGTCHKALKKLSY